MTCENVQASATVAACARTCFLDVATPLIFSETLHYEAASLRRPLLLQIEFGEAAGTVELLRHAPLVRQRA